MSKFDNALQAQKEEMEKYRWLESEKAGHDVGKTVYIDWIRKYAKSWREWWNQDQTH